jgi:hypothetical protein
MTTPRGPRQARGVIHSRGTGSRQVAVQLNAMYSLTRSQRSDCYHRATTVRRGARSSPPNVGLDERLKKDRKIRAQ